VSTILDVAKLAGVSRSTVSRVICGNGPVNFKTRIAVENAIKELNFTPSYFAQGIKTGKTRTIAMMVPDYSNVYYGEMFRGIEKIALQHGYMVMICNTDKSSTREIAYTEELLKRQVDGIIYNTYKQSSKTINYFFELAKRIPMVFMDHLPFNDSSQSYVLTEGFESSRKAVQYLVRKGKKRIGYLRMPPSISVVHHRYAGYKQGLIDAGIEPDKALVYQCTNDDINKAHLQIGYEGAEALMKLDNPPDAIMCIVDIMAVGAINYLKKAGYRIPEDVSVIGFDNITLSTIIEPNLTTIAQPTYQIGEEAAKILMSKINGEEIIEDRIVFEPDFIIRQST